LVFGLFLIQVAASSKQRFHQGSTSELHPNPFADQREFNGGWLGVAWGFRWAASLATPSQPPANPQATPRQPPLSPE